MATITIGNYNVSLTAYDVTNNDGWLTGTVHAEFTENDYRSHSKGVEVQCGAPADDDPPPEWFPSHEGARLLLAMLGCSHDGPLAGHPITLLMPEDCEALGADVVQELIDAADREGV